MRLPKIDNEDILAVAMVLGQLSLGILIPAIIGGALYVIATVWVEFGVVPGLLFLGMGLGGAAAVLILIAGPPLPYPGQPTPPQPPPPPPPSTSDDWHRWTCR